MNKKQIMMATALVSTLAISGCSDSDKETIKPTSTLPLIPLEPSKPITYDISVNIKGAGSLDKTYATVNNGDSYTFNLIKPKNSEVSITGCNGELVGDAYHIASVVSDCTVNAIFTDITEYKATNKHSFNLNPELTILKELEGSIFNIKPNKTDTSFHFGSVYFENGLIINNTPTATDRVIISYGDDMSILLLSEVIPAFSQAEIILPDGISNVLNVYQMRVLDVENHVGSEAKDEDILSQCPAAPIKCNRPALKNEQEVITTMLTNLHYVMNKRTFFDKHNEQMEASCLTVKEFVECKDYDPKNRMPYADMALTTYAHQGHVLKWLVFSQEYNAEGWGSGYRPNINNYVDNSNGQVFLKDRYVNDTDGHFPQYGMRSLRYDTAAHEAGHASGFSHNSGMSYGFGDLVGKYLEANTTQKWREERRDMIVPKIVLNTKYHGDMSVTVKVIATNNTVDYKDIAIDVLSHKPVNYTLKQVANSDEFTLQFEEETFPEHQDPVGNNVNKDMGTVVYIRAYNKEDPDSMVSWVQFDKQKLQPKRTDIEVLTLNGDWSFIIPSHEKGDYNPNNTDGWYIRHPCFYMNARLATEPQLKSLWEKMKRTGDIHNYIDMEFATVTENSNGKQVVSVFSYPDYTTSTRNLGDRIGEDQRFMCMIPTSKI